ncbi:GerMN domain-containing protein [Pedococcus sp. 2YAF34]|uniref:GerMN domain-containing protein n=1 Tax=Pedococcus sp. 2YAF34 TaxID=3233032 RepID=UPI003F984B95
MSSRTSWLRLGAVSAVLLLTGCGAPDHTVPVTITQVPYDLTSPSEEAPATTDAHVTSRPYVYLVREQVLVPVKSRNDRTTDPAVAVTDVLAQLADGPSEGERAAGLSTALGPGTSIRLSGIAAGVATIDLAPGDQVPSASRVPLAVAQVVLTVTSVPGVDQVLVTRNGEPVELPLPGGALTGAPVGASAYTPLTRGGAPTATSESEPPPK